jgi:hypothetical protein
MMNQLEANRTCRYCLDEEDCNDLVHPCSCRGTQQWIHIKCLTQWVEKQAIDSPRRSECGECKSVYALRVHVNLQAFFKGLLLESFVVWRMFGLIVLVALILLATTNLMIVWSIKIYVIFAFGLFSLGNVKLSFLGLLSFVSTLICTVWLGAEIWIGSATSLNNTDYFLATFALVWLMLSLLMTVRLLRKAFQVRVVWFSDAFCIDLTNQSVVYVVVGFLLAGAFLYLFELLCVTSDLVLHLRDRVTSRSFTNKG